MVHPHLAHRKALPVLSHPRRPQGVRVTAAPFPRDGEAVVPQSTAPWRIGEHTREVLGSVLGYDAARIAALQAGGVVKSAD